MSDQSAPIELDFKSAKDGFTAGIATIRTFDSYSFERNILVPASPFRFTAPGVDKDARQAIRSGDSVYMWAVTPSGQRIQLATGFIDETDTHVVPARVEYVLSGRDTMGQMVDNAAVDAANKIINIEKITLGGILQQLIQNTRIPVAFTKQQVPTGTLLFQTNAGETKINALQRYLELTNCLVWAAPNGQLVLGKPAFSQPKQGILALNSAGTVPNNMVECRVHRNLNQAIRQIVTQLQTLEQVDAGRYTINNNDPDMLGVANSRVGRSVYSRFSYGQGNDSVNQVTQVGSQPGNPNSMGAALSLREIARENMKILDVEAVVMGHINENGTPYNVDQVYEVQIEDDDVFEDMYVYSCSYELTMDHGLLTRMRLCRKGTICAYTDALPRKK